MHKKEAKKEGDRWEETQRKNKCVCVLSGLQSYMPYRSLGSIWFQCSTLALLELIVALRYGATDCTIDVLWRYLPVHVCACVFLLQQYFVSSKHLCVFLRACGACEPAYLCRSWCMKALAMSGSSSKCFFLRKSWATASISPTSTSGCSRTEKHRPSTSTSCSDSPHSRPISRPLWCMQSHACTHENNTYKLIGHKISHSQL